MKPPNRYEIEGMYAASETGGAYLEYIGQTDLAKLSEEHWMTFLEKAIRAYEERCMLLYGDPPFPPVDD